MKWNDPGRNSYLEMQEAANRSEKAFQGKGAQERKPWRDRAYGRLKGKVTVQAMNITIGVVIALIVLVVIIGVVSQ